MAMNLTNQVRSIAQVTKAVAGGDLTKKIVVDVRGEILELKETVNGMTESLSVFADEVTRVAREVGTEGRLGGQARVTNVGGTWKDLTDNVNVMANNVRFFGFWFCCFERLNAFFFLVDVTSANHRCGYCMFIHKMCRVLLSCQPFFFWVDRRGSWRFDAENHWCIRLWRDVELG